MIRWKLFKEMPFIFSEMYEWCAIATAQSSACAEHFFCCFCFLLLLFRFLHLCVSTNPSYIFRHWVWVRDKFFYNLQRNQRLHRFFSSFRHSHINLSFVHMQAVRQADRQTLIIAAHYSSSPIFIVILVFAERNACRWRWRRWKRRNDGEGAREGRASCCAWIHCVSEMVIYHSISHYSIVSMQLYWHLFDGHCAHQTPTIWYCLQTSRTNHSWINSFSELLLLAAGMTFDRMCDAREMGHGRLYLLFSERLRLSVFQLWFENGTSHTQRQRASQWHPFTINKMRHFPFQLVKRCPQRKRNEEVDGRVEKKELVDEETATINISFCEMENWKFNFFFFFRHFIVFWQRAQRTEMWTNDIITWKTLANFISLPVARSLSLAVWCMRTLSEWLWLTECTLWLSRTLFLRFYLCDN